MTPKSYDDDDDDDDNDDDEDKEEEENSYALWWWFRWWRLINKEDIPTYHAYDNLGAWVNPYI